MSHVESVPVKTPNVGALKNLIKSLGKAERIAEAARVGPLHATAMKREVGGTLAAVETRRRAQGIKPLVIEGMKFVGFETLRLSEDFDTIEVDRRYQRGEKKAVVNGLMMALRAGGLVLQPVVIARRSWRDEETKAGMRYLVDGQQRIYAYIGAGVDKVHAMIYISESLEAERRAFSILNATGQKVSGNAIVKSMGGVACGLIESCDANEGHPLYRRVMWAQAGNMTLSANIGALMALKGVAFALGLAGSGSTLVPAVLIPKLESKFDHRKADAFLRMLARCVRPGGSSTRAIQGFVLALGQVCHEKWATGGSSVAPSPSQCAALSRVDWRAVTRQSTSLDLLPVVRERIKKVWR